MYSFKNDYSQGAHPKILEALARFNMDQHEGYGLDAHSLRAGELIRRRFGCPGADVHIVSGGTQANLTALSAFLRPHQSIIAVNDGHICVHEAGAIEATGHKINQVHRADAKLRPEDIEAVLAEHAGDEHMVMPKLVYVSDSTELGTVYSRAELTAVRDCCRKHGLILFLDGARLGAALTSPVNDMTPEDIGALCDAFYVGGTKNGLLLGEALVLVNDGLKEDFRYLIKQRGAMLAKGFVAGIQFEAAFSDTLYFDLARHANAMAFQLAAGIEALGYALLTPAASNQIFPILPNEIIAALEKDFGFYIRGYTDEEKSAIRLVTAWSTEEEKVNLFLNTLEQLTKK